MADIIDLFNGDVEKDTDPDATLLLPMGRLTGSRFGVHKVSVGK